MPVVVPRWIQLVTLPLAVIALYLVARAAGVVLLLFITAAVIALILNPLVSIVSRRRVPRPLAIFLVYASFFLVLLVAGFLLANPIADQAQQFEQDVPHIIDSANQSLADLQDTFDDNGIDIQIQRQGQTALETLQEGVVGGTADIVDFGGGLLRRVVTASLGLILIFVISVYMLVYAPRIGALVRRTLPPGDGTPEDDFPALAQKAVAGYVRGQAIFSLLMGTGAGLGLFVLGVTGVFESGDDYALAFGVFFGLMELVPFIGPVLGALPAVSVAFFQDPLTGLWVALFFVAVQQIEGHVVAPLVFGQTLHINPLIVIFSLLLGGEVYGLVGALVALPLAALIRQTFVYLSRHLVLEPWPRTTADPGTQITSRE